MTPASCIIPPRLLRLHALQRLGLKHTKRAVLQAEGQLYLAWLSMQRVPLQEVNGHVPIADDGVSKHQAAATGPGPADPPRVPTQQLQDTLPPMVPPLLTSLQPGSLPQPMLCPPISNMLLGAGPLQMLHQMPSGLPLIALQTPLSSSLLARQPAAAALTAAGETAPIPPPADVTTTALPAPAVQQQQQAAGTATNGGMLGAEQDAEETEHEEEDDEQEDSDEESDWRQMLYDALRASAPPSRFACAGRLAAPSLCPDILVAGVGRLGLPLSKEQGITLKAVAEQAPHGKGLRTVVDTTVRDAFQVDASQITIAASWQPILKAAVSQVAGSLDINDSAACSIEARLYKLLLYEQGGHFSAHQDTEKERGMLGTLVVQLPTAEGHTGGSLTVRHKGQQFTHHFAKDSGTSFQYAAFFADCEHELSPITKGMRLALVYNLVWVGAPGAAPRLVKSSPAEMQLKRALRAWKDDIEDGSNQKRIAFLLDHQYTESNLGFEHLKGSDRAMVRALSTCPGLEAHLVLVTRTVSGTAESEYDYCSYKRRRYCYDYSDDEDEGLHTMGDIIEDHTETGKWIAQDGSAINYGNIDVETDFYDPEDNELFGEDDDPDSENYEGFTSNAGPTLDQIYRRVLLVLWPRSQTMANATRAGFKALKSVFQLRWKEPLSLGPIVQQQQKEAVVVEGPQQEQQQPGDAAAQQDSSSRRQQAVHADVLLALKACMKLLKKQLSQPEPQPRPYSCGSDNRVNTEQLVWMVVQGFKAAHLGIPGSAELLQKFLAAMAESPQVLLTDVNVAKSLAKAAHELGAAAAGPCLLQLLHKGIVSQPGNCIVLISRLSAHPDLQQQLASAAVTAVAASMVDHLLSLAVAVPGLPAVQQAVVDKLAAAVQEGQSPEVASNTASLLSKLNGLPGLQKQLAAALVSKLCAAGPLLHIKEFVQLLGTPSTQPALKERVVKAVAAEVRCSVSWQVGTVMQLLTVLQDAPDMQKLLQEEVAAAVFASDILLANQTDDNLLQLSDMLLQTSELRNAYYGSFAAAVAGRRGSFSLLQQLLQSQQAQAATGCKEQLVSQLCATKRRNPAIWQVTDAWQLLQVLRNDPALQQMLAGTIAECMFTNSDLLSSQSDDSMVQLSSMLLASKTLRAAYYDVFAEVVSQRRGNYPLLKRLLQTTEVRSNLSMTEVQQLVSCQIAHLERTSAVPSFSWHMPKAKVPGHPQVEAFLHGANQSVVLAGFSGIIDARNRARMLTGSSQYRSYCNTNNTHTGGTSDYSITTYASGSGRNARLTITKTKVWYESLVRSKQPAQQELQAVKALKR